MSDYLTEADLMIRLRQQAEAHGLHVGADAEHGVSGDIESILAKWWLGGRKVSYRMSCRLTEADHSVYFREAVVERSWGLPPPTLSVETTTLSGSKLSGRRRDVSVGGGGTIDYAKLRDAIAQSVVAAGWSFRFEAGRMP
ncbi:MAG: hypothetical protein HXX15_13545 [Rhodopseudomonas sp.]|uniref:hypothetical protein n=1 Tax=Rhodopseudomonas sp. TaxID=1078 RepID=UPI0017C441CC|nr:hypothetical protein [Rhodopseudomonas sp.]NVN87099.1 hypothetical protein [Rhodopseudomonas sp.]